MKKRAMKKYIPYGDYCGNCKNSVHSHTTKDIMVCPKELGSNEMAEFPCFRNISKCVYTGVNTLDDCLLGDGVKVCGVKEPDWEL